MFLGLYGHNVYGGPEIRAFNVIQRFHNKIPSTVINHCSYKKTPTKFHNNLDTPFVKKKIHRFSLK